MHANRCREIYCMPSPLALLTQGRQITRASSRYIVSYNLNIDREKPGSETQIDELKQVTCEKAGREGRR
jgi:hypothetical protein